MKPISNKDGLMEYKEGKMQTYFGRGPQYDGR